MNTPETITRNQSFAKLWRIQDWRMAPKLLAAFLLVSIVPLAISGLIALNGSQNALLAQGATNLSAGSQSTSLAIDRYLTDKREDILAISLLPDIIVFTTVPDDPQAVTNAQKAVIALARKTDYESVAIMDMVGAAILSSAQSEVGVGSASTPYFQQAASGLTYISDPSASTSTDQPAIYFSAPVRNVSGAVIGVVRARVSLAGIWSLVEKDKDVAGPGTVGILLDENGVRLAHSASLGNRQAIADTLLYRAIAPLPEETARALINEKRYSRATLEQIDVLPLPEVAAAFTSPSIKTFETTADNSTVRHYGAISSLNVKPWRYVLMTPLPTFTGPADTLRFSLAVFIVIVAALTTIGVLLIARGFTTPIVQLTQVADRISLGELDAQININRTDEIGELAEAVSRMQASLQAAIERLRARRPSA